MTEETKELTTWTVSKKGSGTLYHDIEWVIRALSTDSEKEILQYAQVKEGKLNCVDGFRLHQLDIIDLPLKEGQYKVLKTSSEITLIYDEAKSELKFPDISMLCPDSKKFAAEWTETYINWWVKSTEKRAAIDYSIASIVHAIKGGISIQLFTEVLDGQSLDCFTATNEKPIIFKDNTHYALIMPIKVNKFGKKQAFEELKDL